MGGRCKVSEVLDGVVDLLRLLVSRSTSASPRDGRRSPGAFGLHRAGHKLDVGMGRLPGIILGRAAVAGGAAAFDGGGVQAVDVEGVAQLEEELQFGLEGVAVGGGDIAAERVGGFVESGRQAFAHQAEERVEAVLLGEEIEHGLADHRIRSRS